MKRNHPVCLVVVVVGSIKKHNRVFLVVIVVVQLQQTTKLCLLGYCCLGPMNKKNLSFWSSWLLVVDVLVQLRKTEFCLLLVGPIKKQKLVFFVVVVLAQLHAKQNSVSLVVVVLVQFRKNPVFGVVVVVGPI